MSRVASDFRLRVVHWVCQLYATAFEPCDAGSPIFV